MTKAPCRNCERFTSIVRDGLCFVCSKYSRPYKSGTDEYRQALASAVLYIKSPGFGAGKNNNELMPSSLIASAREKAKEASPAETPAPIIPADPEPKNCAPVMICLPIDTDDLPILERLSAVAKRERRSLESQILSIIEEYVRV